MEPRPSRVAYRSASACAIALSALLVTRSGSADPKPNVSASIECAPATEPGRLRCEVVARAAAPLVLRWGDVEIVSTPDFVTPLRGRIGPRDAVTREPETLRWALALVAKSRGSGDVHARVRLVACESGGDGGAERCSPYVSEAVGRVLVGR